MKTISVRDLQKKIRECMETSQGEGVVVTRRGKPLALLTGVDGYDWEDLMLATNASFWKMIEERRRQQGIPLEEVCRRIGIPMPASRPRASPASGPRRSGARRRGRGA